MVLTRLWAARIMMGPMLPLASPQHFVGRHRDLVALAEAFESRSRLITLVGPEGVGTSRMASEHLHALEGQRRPLHVELGHVRDLPDALALIASCISAPPATGRDPVLSLGETLRDLGPSTLVLDAVDGVRAELRSVLARFLKLSPETHFLVTARTALGIDHEIALAIEPLSLPSDVSERVISDALRLWHTVRGVPLTKLPKTSDPELVRLLRVLSGLPLAIEIAAAHADRLTPFALLERLPSSLRTAGAHGEAAVLPALLDVAWSLLNPAEKQVLAQCSVFASGFPRDAARAIVRAPEGFDLDELLDRLLSKHLLKPGVETATVRREGMHPAVRSYAALKLNALDPEGATQRRHASFFVERGKQRAHELEGPEGPAAILELIRMQPELMAIIEPGLERETGSWADLALGALCVHDHVLSSHGPVDNDLARFERWLAHDSQVSLLVRVEALCVRSFVRARIGRMPAAREDLAQAEALLTGTEHARSYDAGRVAVTSAFVAMLAGDLTQAEARIETCMQIATTLGHARLEGIALGVLSLLRRAQGKPEEAMGLYERALTVHRSVQNLRFEGIVLTRLAQAHLERGELDLAHDRAEAARTLHKTFGDRAMEGLCLVVQGTVFHARAELDQARVALDTARPLLAAVGDAPSLSMATSLLACVRAELGDLEVSRQLFETVAAASTEPTSRAALRAMLWRASLDALLDEDGERLAAERDAATQKLRDLGDTSGLDLVALSRIFAELARLRQARSEKRPDAQAHLQAARAALHAARLAISHRAASLPFHDRHDLVTALRFTELMLAAHTPEDDETRPHLRLPFHARWFEPPRAERVDARRRAAMRRILVHLALRASAAPHTPQSAMSLFAAGWPDEHPGEDNALLQVYAVLGSLRKTGLGDLLVAEQAGHYLSSSLTVSWVA